MNLSLDWPGHRILALGARLYLGGLFVWASLHKIASPSTFALDVATYQFLPLIAVNLFALLVPWLEALAGALLLVGIRVRAAALVVASLMLAFMVALAWALHLGLDMSCGCFASESATTEHPISWLTLLRDTGWLALAIYVMIFDVRPLGLVSLIQRKRRTS